MSNYPDRPLNGVS